MKALLVVAHGSRREDSNQEVRQLTAELATRTHEYDDVRCAFLELAEPSIPEGIAQCIAQGAQEVVVLPYFLSAGRHVAKDIPDEVAKAQQAHPTAKLRIAPYLGMADSLKDALLSLAAKNPA
jgi:sirohydrochlorin ferrochelatase